jgi:hypothetical protein
VIWVLTVLMCNGWSAECWREERGVYGNERACMFAGLKVKPYEPWFKCVSERVPLPRPRPLI